VAPAGATSGGYRAGAAGDGHGIVGYGQEDKRDTIKHPSTGCYSDSVYLGEFLPHPLWTRRKHKLVARGSRGILLRSSNSKKLSIRLVMDRL